MTENNPADQATDEIPARMRIRALLMAKGHTIASWARSRGIDHDEQVHMTISGTREYPEIRDMLASDLGISRAELDEILETPKAA